VSTGAPGGGLRGDEIEALRGSEDFYLSPISRTSTMPEPTLCCRVPGGYCDRCDLLVGLPGLRVIGVERDGRDRLVVTVESAAEPMGCRSCGVIARGHGRVDVHLVDAPAFGVRCRGRSPPILKGLDPFPLNPPPDARRAILTPQSSVRSRQ
jgi:hypothetical protein